MAAPQQDSHKVKFNSDRNVLPEVLED